MFFEKNSSQDQWVEEVHRRRLLTYYNMPTPVLLCLMQRVVEPQVTPHLTPDMTLSFYTSKYDPLTFWYNIVQIVLTVALDTLSQQHWVFLNIQTIMSPDNRRYV